MSAATASAQGTVRRLIVHVLLFVLVVVAATGAAGLLGRLLDADLSLAEGGAADLALSLAFTLIGAPLAALLWWSTWRRLDDPDERGALAWGLYVTAALTVALVVSTTSIAVTLGELVDGRWDGYGAANGLVWAAVWAWHRWMLRHPAKGPTRMATVPAVLGSAYGLVVAVIGFVGAFGATFDAAIRGTMETPLVGHDWWLGVLRSLIWAAIGLAVWWWHWVHDAVRRIPTVFAAVDLVVVGVLGGAAVALGGLGTALDVGLRLAFDPSETASILLAPLGTALAAAGVGAIVWRVHARIAGGHGPETRRAASLVVSGLGLAAAATGIGVILNATLAALSGPLAATDSRALLLAGISTLVVGGPTWWLHWRPTRRIDPAEAADVGRRVYLVAVFGASAVVAIVALLVVGYRVFEFLLDASAPSALIDRIRAPLGLLVATVLVFAYHFAVWRSDRAAIAAAGITTGRRIGRVVLVASGDTVAAERALAAATGAPVVVWRRAPAAVAAAVPAGGPAGEAAPGPDPVAVTAALEGVEARRVLVLADPDGRIEVVPLVE